ncbi:MAG: hypothetical protein HY079_12700 [Elusimicrobia bacterium]|nr:hypothetical protein [Elusimicrobiota bacterium]
MIVDWPVYLLLVFAASGGVYGLIFRLGGVEGAHFARLATALMWVPGIFALSAFALNGELRRSPGWKPGGWPYWGLALFVPPLLYVAAAGAFVASGAATFPETLASVRGWTVHLAGARAGCSWAPRRRAWLFFWRTRSSRPSPRRR